MMEMTTLEKTNSPWTTRMAKLSVAALGGSEWIEIDEVFTRPGFLISREHQANNTQDTSEWPHLKNLPLARDVPTEQVTLLIGQNCPAALEPMQVARGKKGDPFGVLTPRLGWVMNGPLRRECPKNANLHVATTMESRDELLEKVERFWRLESSGLYEEEQAMSVEDSRVLESWRASLEYKDGHYLLPIPFRDPEPDLPDNLEMARKRLDALGRKLQRDGKLREQYIEGMKDLIQKGYATTKVPANEQVRTDGKQWYIPHHPVVTAAKPKPRIVFDCAAKYRGVSLNDKVRPGPDLNNSLIGVLNRFRLGKVAFMADVQAMFYQVTVAQQDRDVLRFLWWPDGNMDQEPEM